MRGPVAADDDLFLRIMQGIEGMEELHLCPFLARDKLNVIHEKNVDTAVLSAEVEDAVEPEGIDHLVHKTFRRDV